MKNLNIKNILATALELIVLGAVGFVFNRVSNAVYEEVIGEKAQMPMKIGIICTYFLLAIPAAISFSQFMTSPEGLRLMVAIAEVLTSVATTLVNEPHRVAQAITNFVDAAVQ